MVQLKTIPFLFFFINIASFAQIKGIVKDSISGKPIPYVNIWVENENIGTTSEEDGTFQLNVSKDKNLIFSTLGFEKKKVKAINASIVNLKETITKLEEVIISKRLETRIIEIGKSKNAIFQAFDNGPKIDVKYFPFLLKYKNTRYIKQVTIETDCKIDNATIKIHFYKIDSNGFPGEELLDKDFIVSVSKGVTKNFFDVSHLNLIFPKKGLFVGYEKLIIEKNKSESTITNFNNNTTSVKKTYSPLVLYNFEEREFTFTFFGGKWNKELTLDKNNAPIKKLMFEPAINLVLSN